jgi:2-iminobutanoate/2-iminopropanoate deaminase
MDLLRFVKLLRKEILNCTRPISKSLPRRYSCCLRAQPANLLFREEKKSVSKRRSFEVSGLKHENPIPMGCIIGNIMMSSGIFGMEPETRKFPDDIEGQCKLMFENVRKVMAAAGGSTDDIIKIVVWAKEKTFKNAVNKEWLAMFPDEHSRPARHTMIYGGFTGNTLIQCEIVAVLKGT